MDYSSFNASEKNTKLTHLHEDWGIKLKNLYRNTKFI